MSEFGWISPSSTLLNSAQTGGNNADLKRVGTIFSKSKNFGFIGLRNSSSFPWLKEKAKVMWLVVNAERMKYILQPNKQSTQSRLCSTVIKIVITSKLLTYFIYLATITKTNNNACQRRMNLANKCFLDWLCKGGTGMKIKFYKLLIFFGGKRQDSRDILIEFSLRRREEAEKHRTSLGDFNC